VAREKKRGGERGQDLLKYQDLSRQFEKCPQDVESEGRFQNRGKEGKKQEPAVCSILFSWAVTGSESGAGGRREIRAMAYEEKNGHTLKRERGYTWKV